MKRIILTGAIGAGKSTVLALLEKAGLAVVAEPARAILAEQRRIGGQGVPEKDSSLFVNLLLSRAIRLFDEVATQAHDVIVFDRGIPDTLAYAELFDLDTKPANHASRHYRYHDTVFFFPGWEAIYTTDDERKLSFAEANQFGDNLAKYYQSQGYQLIEMPFVSPEARAELILEAIKP